MTEILCVPLSAALPGSASSGNGEFGEWNAFTTTSPPASTTAVSAAPSAVTDLFGDAPAPQTQAPAASSTQPPSADLFDLMGPNHSTLSASQSMSFNMCANQGMPMSRSQVPISVMPSLFHLLNGSYSYSCKYC